MRFGIDFGTTHTVVAAVDRGNYPVVAFEQGDVIPSLIAADAHGGLHFGHAAREPGLHVLRSFKRLLDGDAGPRTVVELAGRRFPLLELVAGFLAHVRAELVSSYAGLRPGDAVEAAISVPANA